MPHAASTDRREAAPPAATMLDLLSKSGDFVVDLAIYDAGRSSGRVPPRRHVCQRPRNPVAGGSPASSRVAINVGVSAVH
ncbi:hypothetical protein CO657_30320 (plasmid) [Rhizobium acidisoli]|uniref:Uncharacterized protein n=1 Tax=Rhizobium acidisoli TaxID=1538158 RepID=A0AAE5WTP6_9HYPH|nr:hypothetical protein CO657_30320 [Rhizobium acidisoli]